jgi:hypothetical protein
LLPAVLKYNARHTSEARNDVVARQAKVKEIIWSVPEVAKVLEKSGLEGGFGCGGCAESGV